MGRVGGWPLLLLTTRGRKSGRQRTVVLGYLQDGDAYVVVASFGGSPTHPAWYLNLQADPMASMQLGGTALAIEATTAMGDERARLWNRLVEGFPGYRGYQEKTSREIPVVVLRPVDEAGAYPAGDKEGQA